MPMPTNTAREQLAKTYLRWSLVPVFIFCFPLLLFAFWVEPINGDLTRIGHWPEHDFGFNAPHPVIRLNANGRAVSQPDVLVLGDSFSVRNYWQSVLTREGGGRTQTYDYSNVECIDGWVKWAIHNPDGHTIIIETVEREFVPRFSKFSNCSKAHFVATEVGAGLTNPIRAHWPPIDDIGFLFNAAINTLRMNLQPTKDVRGNVTNSPLRPHCASFSNRRADRLLYYSHDNDKAHWTNEEIQQAVSNIRQLQEDAHKYGKQLVFVVAPDKLSAYRDCLGQKSVGTRYPNVTEALIEAGVKTPNLLATFKSNVGKVTDLYNPNNTHWSEEGYMLAASEIRKAMQ
jgi:hypothetical protein